MTPRKKVPVVLQVSPLECGAACLTMVLRAHGIRATLAECRSHLATGPKGVNAFALSEAALKLGLRARAFAAKSRAEVRELTLPAIVHFGHNHFVVLEGWSSRRDRVFIVDPATGRRRLAWSDFLARYSGAALVFEPGAAPPPTAPPGALEPASGLIRWASRRLGMAENRSGGGCTARLALILAILALAIAWAAYRRQGGELRTLRQDLSRGGERVQITAGPEEDLRTWLKEAQTKLERRRSDVVGERNLDDVREDVVEIRENLERAYREGGAGASKRWRELDGDLERLEGQLKQGGAKARAALDEALAKIRSEVGREGER